MEETGFMARARNESGDASASTQAPAGNAVLPAVGLRAHGRSTLIGALTRPRGRFRPSGGTEDVLMGRCTP